MDENFSGEINLTESYALNVTKVNASNSKINVEIIGNDNVSEITSGKGNDNVHNSRSFTVIHTGAGKDIVSSDGDNNSINSGVGNDLIVNVGNQNSIDAGKGNDSIISDGKKNIFAVNDGGDKIIYVFGATDTLQITDDSGTYSKKIKGDDLIITADDSKITLAGAKDLNKVHIKAAKTKGRNIRNQNENEFILGTSKADTIENRGDNVTISSGKGNDYVNDWGIGTAYIYSGGNDVIHRFDNSDMLKITGAFSASYNRSKNEIYFDVGSTKNAITLKDFDATTFNVNGDAYHISGKKLVK